MEAVRQGIRKSRYQKPTSPQPNHDLHVLDPTDKSSSLKEDLPVFRMTSGARYSGVPHSVYVSLLSTFLAKPKSTNFK